MQMPSSKVCSVFGCFWISKQTRSSLLPIFQAVGSYLKKLNPVKKNSLRQNSDFLTTSLPPLTLSYLHTEKKIFFDPTPSVFENEY